MSNGGWYYARGQEQVGPFELTELGRQLARASAREHTLVFGPGLANWTEARLLAEVMDVYRAASGSAAGAGASPPPPPVPGHIAADVIDYEIFGNEMQYAVVTLDPGEMVTAEPGAMMFMSSGIKMDTMFGDPSARDQGGLL